MLEHTQWGPGRTDTFNPNKVLFNFPLDRLPQRERNAAVDFPSIWLQKPRQGMQLHWDGNNVMSEERNKNAAFGTGTTPPTIDLKAIGRIEEWLLTAEPPKFEQPVDPSARGEAARSSMPNTAPAVMARTAATSVRPAAIRRAIV